jgi:hypothetical protein
LEVRIDIQRKVIVGLLAAVEDERQGVNVDRDVIRRCVYIWMY